MFRQIGCHSDTKEASHPHCTHISASYELVYLGVGMNSAFHLHMTLGYKLSTTITLEDQNYCELHYFKMK